MRQPSISLNRSIEHASEGAESSQLMEETRKQFVLQLMQPMLREFNKTLIEMRDRGQTETEIAGMLDKIEVDNRGKVEDWILDDIMSELRLATRADPKPKSHK
jgi:hypothetical protein